MDAKWVVLTVLSLFHIDCHAAILDLMEDSLYMRAEVKFSNPDFGLKDVYQGSLLQEDWTQGVESYYDYGVYTSGTKYFVPEEGIYEYHSSDNQLRRYYRPSESESLFVANDVLFGRYAPGMNNRYLDGWSELETDLQWIFQITGDDARFYGKWDYSDYPGNMMLYDVTTQTLLGSMNSAPGKGFSFDLEDGHQYLLDIDTYVSGYESDSRIWEFEFTNTDINIVKPSMLAKNVAEPSILALMIAGSLPLILFNFRSAYFDPV